MDPHLIGILQDGRVRLLLRYLTVVSGGLAGAVTEATSGTAAGLGLAAAWLQKEGYLRQSVLVPVDPYAHLFTSASAPAAQQGKQRCDLALFSLRPHSMEVAFMEVKWRKNHQALDVLGSAMYFQMKASQQAFAARFFGAGSCDEVQRSHLVNILRTYLEHACRLGLFAPQAKPSFLECLQQFGKTYLEFRSRLEGYIVSPHDTSQSFQIRDANIHVLTAADF